MQILEPFVDVFVTRHHTTCSSVTIFVSKQFAQSLCYYFPLS